ncbi:hypothetical protein [Paracoccus benzoatiresistens]|uniref:Uncharacterized protein n=1 Tax=Paracoccus benzoatiresistens TaxID=2997341 RepID=A0ABT4J1D1_9RHOB|nr:hypothetical protein [Paracoccus sp. EF6]MCZ0960902.1 hypothetical protein [Paracoccus sp. EF6]
MLSYDGSKGFASVIIRILLPPTLVLLLLTPPLWMMKSTATRQHSAEQEAARQIERANQSIEEKCSGAGSLISCENEVIDASRDYERGEYDLAAQQDMAQYALFGLFVAWSGVLVTSVATFFVYRTLQATLAAVGEAEKATAVARDATQVTARQFRASFKPWINVELRGPFLGGGECASQVRSLEPDEVERPVSIQAQAFVHSIGSIPAIIDDFDIRLMEGPEWPYVPNSPRELGGGKENFFAIMHEGQSIQIDPELGITTNLAPLAVIVLTRENYRSFRMNPPPIVGWVSYSDPLGVRYKHHFAFVAKPAWGDKFLRYGGRRLNYEREVEDGRDQQGPHLGGLAT